MLHLELFSRKQKARKARGGEEAREAEQETNEQRRENKMQRGDTGEREKEEDTWAKERGHNKEETRTERERQRRSQRGGCATIATTILRGKIYKTLGNTSRMLSIWGGIISHVSRGAVREFRTTRKPSRHTQMTRSEFEIKLGANMREPKNLRFHI